MPTSTISIQHDIGNPSHNNQKKTKQNKTKTEVKGVQIGRKAVILSHHADEVTVYIEHPKAITHQLLALVNSAIYKIGIWKSPACLHANRMGK